MPVCFAIAIKCAETCMASSRVGTMISACSLRSFCQSHPFPLNRQHPARAPICVMRDRTKATHAHTHKHINTRERRRALLPHQTDAARCKQ